jgi:hypothetical protein
MKHILITRFDYPSSYRNIEERIDLFRRFTVPSIQNQLCQDFTWAIKTKLPLSDLGLDGMNVVKIDSEKKLQEFALDERIITTRIDNDDAVHTSYIAKIQFYAEKVKDGTFIDFNGYCFDSRKNKIYKSNKYVKVTSPFVSVVENGLNMKGIYMDFHNRLDKHGPVLKLDSRMWMQIIHDTNVSNKVTSVGEVLDEEAARELWGLFGR